MKIHKYSKSNRFSEDPQIMASSNKFIRKKLSKFYKVKEIVFVKDKTLQSQGVDKILTTFDSKIIRIEEKIRKVTRSDVLLELIGDNRRYLKEEIGLGWALRPYDTDLLLYYFVDSDSGILLSWKKFKVMLDKNLPKWYDLAKKEQKGFALKKAHNVETSTGEKRYYYSLNIVVPMEDLKNAYTEVGGKII
jgi:hypothetical protein